MFDPTKYDNTDIQGNQDSKKNNFVSERYEIIDYLNKKKAVIVKECEQLEAYVKKNPDSNAVGPFKEKLAGWSRILVGLEIVDKMYNG